jgi:acetyl esterase/lipase
MNSRGIRGIGRLVLVLGAAIVGASMPAAAASSITIRKAIPYVDGAVADQTLDVYRPAAPGENRPVIMMVHGGGWVAGSADDMARHATLAARQGWVAFNITYRGTSVLGKDGQAWPAERDDVRAALQWVIDNAHRFGGAADRIAVLGASAGGNLAALATADGPEGVRAVALWSAPTDLAPLVQRDGAAPPACEGHVECIRFWSGTWVTDFLGCDPEECPSTYSEASPVDQVGRSTLPTFIVNSEDEIVPPSQAEDLGAALERAGVRHEVRILGGDRHAYAYTADVWNDMMPFLARELGVAEPEPIDFETGALTLDTPLLVMIGLGIILLVGLGVGLARHRSDADGATP